MIRSYGMPGWEGGRSGIFAVVLQRLTHKRLGTRVCPHSIPDSLLLCRQCGQFLQVLEAAREPVQFAL